MANHCPHRCNLFIFQRLLLQRPPRRSGAPRVDLRPPRGSMSGEAQGGMQLERETSGVGQTRRQGEMRAGRKAGEVARFFFVIE